MKSPAKNLVLAAAYAAIGVALAAMGIYVSDTDDAPGAALIGIVVMIVLVTLGVKAARRNAS